MDETAALPASPVVVRAVPCGGIERAPAGGLAARRSGRSSGAAAPRGGAYGVPTGAHSGVEAMRASRRALVGTLQLCQSFGVNLPD